jgi:peptidoglycan-associated lipoprotein
MNKRSVCWIVLATLLVLFAAGCKKKVPPPPPPPPPPQEKPAPPPKPSAPAVDFFTAEPASIQRGQSATLRWSVKGAERISIDQGIGTVQPAGDRQAFPSASTTYTLTATGPGGTSTATARVSVTAPPPPPPPAETPKARRTITDALAAEVQDAYFDYDKYDVREDARSVLTRNSDALKRIFQEFPSAVITIEGHCDERGSAEYNLGLGDRRSSSAKEFLTQLGVAADRLRTVSYGKERPQCTEATEDCYQKNRRVHFAAGQ